MTDQKDDPAFRYFPTNYRWSMGLLLCLSAAPWGGAEIDEVNRVGRVLKDKVGDDKTWFEEWTRMGDHVEARGRDALATWKPQDLADDWRTWVTPHFTPGSEHDIKRRYFAGE